PKTTSVAEVERIITGMSDKEIRDAITDGKPSH
ncbi:sugar ABC transporter ATP-binding protein, partial [Mesorhizobium sp. M7A.F.Ca.CA.001.05.1.1]